MQATRFLIASVCSIGVLGMIGLTFVPFIRSVTLDNSLIQFDLMSQERYETEEDVPLGG